MLSIVSEVDPLISSLRMFCIRYKHVFFNRTKLFALMSFLELMNFFKWKRKILCKFEDNCKNSKAFKLLKIRDLIFLGMDNLLSSLGIGDLKGKWGFKQSVSKWFFQNLLANIIFLVLRISLPKLVKSRHCLSMRCGKVCSVGWWLVLE